MIRPDKPSPKISDLSAPQINTWEDAPGFENEAIPESLPLRKTPDQRGLKLRESAHTPDLQVEPDVHRLPSSGSRPTLEVQEISNDLIHLEVPSSSAGKVIHQAVLEKRAEDPRLTDKFFGEGNEWGTAKQISIRWISIIVLLTLAMFLAAWLIEPSIRKSNPQRRISSIPTLMPDAQIETLDSLAMREILNCKEQAMKIFTNYAKASEVRDFLPDVYAKDQIEDLIHSHWLPLKAPKHWQVPKNAEWRVAGTASKPLGLMESTLPDYSKLFAYFVYQNGRVFLDWKATSGFGTATFSQLRNGQGDASEIRGLISPLSFYTPTWPESEYKCFQLLSPDGETAIWCYARRTEAVAEELDALFQASVVNLQPPSVLKVTLHLLPGGVGSLPSQWLIKEMHFIDWIES